MKKTAVILLSLLLLSGCSQNKRYEYYKEIKLAGMNPISTAVGENGIWVSDSKNNEIVLINEKGKISKRYKDFKRPMHISLFEGKVFVPEYLSDSIKVISNGKVLPLNLSIKPDAPGGIDVNDSLIAIADFYNHRIIFKTKSKTFTFGKKGHNAGELFYPTDVKIVKDKIVVADAYNNRVQIFSVKGKFIKAIGERDKIKVATGIDADENKIIVTDSGNNRVIIYDWNGNKIEELTKNLNYPIDATIDGNKLFICNFHVGSIAVYKR
ncbi:NHL repeat protein [bacterium BMS3Abin04]|nr:NHL repeat protein [bacterium BMS3Abin04]